MKCGRKLKIKQLKAQLKSIKKQGQTASDYILKIKNVTDSLAALGNPLSKEEHVEVLLEGLYEEYQNLLLTVNAKPEIYSLVEVEYLIMSHDDIIEKFKKNGSGILQDNLTQNSFPVFHNSSRENGLRRGRGGRFPRGRGPSTASTTPPPPAPSFHHPTAFLAVPNTIADPAWYPDTGASHYVTPNQSNLLTCSEYTAQNRLKWVMVKDTKLKHYKQTMEANIPPMPSLNSWQEHALLIAFHVHMFMNRMGLQNENIDIS
ncbi:uncharacterized protein [Arachis hypogaea]|uniref:uncharacterized protein n=1 Tax=Arachis hypogaea TaxID=3818 RepID=UPI003B2176DF